ncbi:hypothetical protein Tco_0584227 [Tanacetum coccineum]
MKQTIAREGLSAAHKKLYEFEDISATDGEATQGSSCSDTDEEIDDETDDFDDSDMDLSDDIYTDAQTTLVVAYQEGNPELKSYISGASDVPLGTHKANKNMRKINFKKAAAKKFKEYDHKLEALTNINVSEVIEKVVHAKVLTEMKKLLPTHVPKSVADYVKPRLNNFVSKAKAPEQKYHNKSNDLHPTYQKLYDTLYDSITLDQQAIDTQGRFTKNSGLANAVRRTTWFDLLLKSRFDQDKNHILGPSTVAIAKKLKELIQKDELIIADLEDA